MKDSVARLVKATTGDRASLRGAGPDMVIADETDDAAMAKWEHYVDGTDHEAIAWRDGQAEDDPNPAIPSLGRTSARRFGMQQLPTNRACLSAPMPRSPACWTNWPRCPACRASC